MLLKNIKNAQPEPKAKAAVINSAKFEQCSLRIFSSAGEAWVATYSTHYELPLRVLSYFVHLPCAIITREYAHDLEPEGFNLTAQQGAHKIAFTMQIEIKHHKEIVHTVKKAANNHESQTC